MARNYQQAKIYCIKVNTEEEYLPYVGSSCKRLLSQRMNQHRDDYKKWKKGKHNFVSSFTLFEKYGIENCFIELIELFPCKCNDELRKKEREHIEKMKCINIVKRVIITEEERVEQKKEYAEINKEKFVECQKIYQQTHKKQIAEKKKEYAEINKEKIVEYQKEWREEHKEKIAEKAKEKYECPCGSICRKSDKNRHERSKKHQTYLTTVNTLCSIAITESP